MRTKKDFKVDGFTEHKHFWERKGEYGTTLLPKIRRSSKKKIIKTKKVKK
jgi:hypothetical protein